METLNQDLRYALRTLRRSPGFAAVAVLSLALGIGANTAIFSIVNAVLLRPLPFEDADRLVAVYSVGEEDAQGFEPISYPDYTDLRDQNEVLSGLSAYSLTYMGLDTGGGNQMILGEIVSGNYFSVLGVDAEHGRTFLPEEDGAPGAHPVAVVSHEAWERRFGADPDLVGRTLVLNGHPFTVIGIAPDWFGGTLHGLLPELWVPLAMHQQIVPSDPGRIADRSQQWLSAMGRLAPGVDLEQARAHMATLGRRLVETYPESGSGRVVRLVPASAARIHPVADEAILGASGLLLGAVGLVLLIACANVASMLLARAAARRKEIGIRLALGAPRGRLIRQLLTESVLMALGGGAVGLLLALWSNDLLTSFIDSVRLILPVNLDIGLALDGRVLAFTLLLSLATGILFGLVPALQSTRPDVLPALRDEGGWRPGARRRSLLRNGLVVGQIALSLVLLISAGLFLRSLLRAHLLDPGFDPEGVVVATFDLSLRRNTSVDENLFYQQLTERIASYPNVEAATVATHLPLTLAVRTTEAGIEGREVGPRGELPRIDFANVWPRYFETMRIPILTGREFTPYDRAEGRPVVIINETMARRFWPDESPLGRRIRMGSNRPYAEIVGVAADGKYRTLGEAPRFHAYVPLLQEGTDIATLIVRGSGDPAPLMAAMRQEVKSLDASLPLFNLQPLSEAMSISLLPPRAAAAAFSAIGSLGLFLAAVGIYGLLAFSVAQRIQEFGIRIALGAGPGAILRLVLGQGVRLALTGVVIGLLASVALTRFLSSLLLGVSATDPITFVGIPLVLIGITVLACYLPARRATRVDPITALRYE